MIRDIRGQSDDDCLSDPAWRVQMKYLPSFVCLFASFLHSALLCASSPAEPVRPNVIFILADDLGYGELGCYGQEVIQTPRLDQMARRSRRAGDTYATVAAQPETRCSGLFWLCQKSFPDCAEEITIVSAPRSPSVN